MASLVPWRPELMDEVHQRASEFCIRPEARYSNSDTEFDPTIEDNKWKCLVCHHKYGKGERKNNHLRRHFKASTIPALLNNRGYNCKTCEKFMDRETDIQWKAVQSPKPDHTASCEREYKAKLKCPACLKGPVKWSK